MNNEEILKQLNWRYATKVFDKGKKLSAEDINMIKETFRLTASCFNVQPWVFIHVKDAETRNKLKEQAWGQPQVSDASDLFVLAVRKELSPEFIDSMIQDTADYKGISVELLKSYKDAVHGLVEGLGTGSENWSKKQVYIALGQVLAVCAIRGIDAAPMEGFSPDGFDKVLGLEELGLKTAVIVGMGYRSAEDQAASAPKFRLSTEKIFIER